jgi:hypothetical protein
MLWRAPQAVVRGLMSREHCLLTCHTLEGDLEARQKALQDLESGATKVGGWGCVEKGGDRGGTFVEGCQGGAQLSRLHTISSTSCSMLACTLPVHHTPVQPLSS